MGKWISKLKLLQKRRTKCSCMVSAHGLSAIVVTAPTMYTYNVLSLLGGFRSRVGYVTDIKSVIQQVTQFPYLV